MKLLNSILNLCPQSLRRPGKSTHHAIHHIELIFKYRDFNDCELRSANSTYRNCTFTNVTFVNICNSQFDQCEFVSCSGTINFSINSYYNMNNCTTSSKCDIYVKWNTNTNYDINEIISPQIDSADLFCDFYILKNVLKEEIITASSADIAAATATDTSAACGYFSDDCDYSSDDCDSSDDDCDSLSDDCTRFYVGIDRVIDYSYIWHFYTPV